MRLRLKFRKEGPIRFVGHLDLMRTMQKTFRRAGVPIAYSEGFNPRQVFSFATALAVGISSEAEYMDLNLIEEVNLDALIDSINETAPPGIVIVEGVVLEEKEPKAMAVLAAARYKIEAYKPLITAEMIESFLKDEEAIVVKRNKKGKFNDFDIKPGIMEVTIDGQTIDMLIATGSQLNIKPEMVLTYVLNKAGLTYDRGDFNFHRSELYHDMDGLKPLLIPKLG